MQGTESEATLERALVRDRLRRQRFVAILLTTVCALSAAFYYVAFAPALTISDDRWAPHLSWLAWLRVTWMGVVIVVVGLTNLARTIVLTVEIRRPR